MNIQHRRSFIANLWALALLIASSHRPVVATFFHGGGLGAFHGGGFGGGFGGASALSGSSSFASSGSWSAGNALGSSNALGLEAASGNPFLGGQGVVNPAGGFTLSLQKEVNLNGAGGLVGGILDNVHKLKSSIESSLAGCASGSCTGPTAGPSLSPGGGLPSSVTYPGKHGYGGGATFAGAASGASSFAGAASHGSGAGDYAPALSPNKNNRHNCGPQGCNPRGVIIEPNCDGPSCGRVPYPNPRPTHIAPPADIPQPKPTSPQAPQHTYLPPQQVPVLIEPNQPDYESRVPNCHGPSCGGVLYPNPRPKVEPSYAPLPSHNSPPAGVSQLKPISPQTPQQTYLPPQQVPVRRVILVNNNAAWHPAGNPSVPSTRPAGWHPSNNPQPACNGPACSGRPTFSNQPSYAEGPPYGDCPSGACGKQPTYDNQPTYSNRPAYSSGAPTQTYGNCNSGNCGPQQPIQPGSSPKQPSSGCANGQCGLPGPAYTNDRQPARPCAGGNCGRGNTGLHTSVTSASAGAQIPSYGSVQTTDSGCPGGLCGVNPTVSGPSYAKAPNTYGNAPVSSGCTSGACGSPSNVRPTVQPTTGCATGSCGNNDHTLDDLISNTFSGASAIGAAASTAISGEGYGGKCANGACNSKPVCSNGHCGDGKRLYAAANPFLGQALKTLPATGPSACTDGACGGSKRPSSGCSLGNCDDASHQTASGAYSSSSSSSFSSSFAASSSSSVSAGKSGSYGG